MGETSVFTHIGSRHESRTVHRMPLVRLVILAVICAIPSGASAQPWADAYRAGDYQKAADLLHPIVASFDLSLGSRDPQPFRYLALMYARGLGVAPDPITACALAQMVDLIMQTGGALDADDGRGYWAMIKDSEAFVRTHCGQLSDDDRLAALDSVECYAFGMPEEVLTVGKHTVRVGHRGIALAGVDDGRLIDLQCPVAVARVWANSIQPPDDAAPGVKVRHFVNMISWHKGQDPQTGTRRYLLQWNVYEVDGKGITVSAMELLRSTDTWPRSVLPPDLETRLSMEMIRSGHVRWKLDGTPPRRGWIMLPEKNAR